MFNKLLSSLGIASPASRPPVTEGLHRPYAESHVNVLYNLLFCDDLDLFRQQNADPASGPWPALLAPTPDAAALARIGDDAGEEGRVRALACNRLRAAGVEVAPKQLFGVIVEVPLEGGLDVLAAFSEGGVRYLNQSGKVAIFDGEDTPVAPLARELIAVAQPVVDRIGPWDKPRLAPPQPGNVRLTFLVSDGLYFGEGPFAALRGDALAGPVLAKATELLQRAVDLGTQ